MHCTYDTDSLSGSGTEASKRRVKGTLHWVSAKHAVPAEVRLYDRLFTDEAPDSHKDKDFTEFINPDSLIVNKNALVEPSLKTAKEGDRFQFQRLGYFVVDKDSTKDNLVFNRTVALKDSWAKQEKKSNTSKQNAKNEFLDKISSLAGKYLKSREEDERQTLIKNIFELSKNIKTDELIQQIETANSNKEFLAALMQLNSKNIPVNETEIKKIIPFVQKGLEMKNSYVRFQATDAVGNYNLRDNFTEKLKEMATSDKNTHIVERLKEIL